MLRQRVPAGQQLDSAISAACRRSARITRQGSSNLPTSTSRGRLLTCLFALSKHCLSGFGPCWVRAGLGVGVLEPVGELLELVGEQVPVAVQCHRRRGMAELSDLCSDSVGKGCLAVTQPRRRLLTYGRAAPTLEEGSPWPSCSM